ncbi:hypothetical protein GUI37_08430 [Helcococcus kunzii]|uniref:hypothetical protein n=1 Tax=Helcococcus kunzii TaxID=40091 RepID=UPI001BAFDED1|nr:hypothetical protein [Helcococcus kunzii]QUY65548.1 hypothetical protein GUI37_08430 [Helcococcus kunzii]
MDNIKIDLPSNPQYLQMLRLSTASIANKVGFDIDKVEDVKVVVSEIFTYLLPDNDRILVNFDLSEKGLSICFVRKKIEKEEGLNDANFEIKKQILLYLSDDLQLEDEKITVIINKE